MIQIQIGLIIYVDLIMVLIQYLSIVLDFGSLSNVFFLKKIWYLILDMENKKMYKMKDIIFCNNECYCVVKIILIFY